MRAMNSTALAINPSLPLVATREDTLDDRFSALLAEYERPVYRFIVSIVNDADIACDCVQDAFVRGYEAMCKGKTINRAWLFTVARNLAMDEFRRQRRTPYGDEKLERIETHDTVDTGLAVEQAMNRLPPVDREVLYLFAVAGFKTDEIGLMLGVQGAAIRQRLYRAREKFRRVYGETA